MPTQYKQQYEALADRIENFKVDMIGQSTFVTLFCHHGGLSAVMFWMAYLFFPSLGIPLICLWTLIFGIIWRKEMIEFRDQSLNYFSAERTALGPYLSEAEQAALDHHLKKLLRTHQNPTHLSP